VFTGIIETVGVVTGLEQRGEFACLAIEAPGIVDGVRIGDSVAINGSCLTVTAGEGDSLHFEAVRETLQRTALGDLGVGSRVNLERALSAGARLDGHIVQGHVDGTGRVDELRRDGEDVRLFIGCGPEVADLLVDKGSVAVDGVSLTVVGARPDGFDVALIPHTLVETTLGERRAGDRVNLEADILGKYVKRYLERILPGANAGSRS
jgi:riboflavin synthase